VRVTDPAVRRTVATWARRPGRAVILDFNGTLSDDEPILEAVFREIFAEHLGWEMTVQDYRVDLLGHSDREIVEHAVHHHGDGAPETVEMLLSRRRTLYQQAVADQPPISAVATAFVERLVDQGVPVAIVTGAHREDVDAVLDHSPVGRLVEHLVTEEDVARGKPDPEGFLQGAALLGVEPEDVLVFEDSLPGITAAQRAGMTCIAVVGDEPGPAVVQAVEAHVPRLEAALLDT
jgi:beta-phosphoglucomutase